MKHEDSPVQKLEELIEGRIPFSKVRKPPSKYEITSQLYLTLTKIAEGNNCAKTVNALKTLKSDFLLELFYYEGNPNICLKSMFDELIFEALATHPSPEQAVYTLIRKGDANTLRHLFNMMDCHKIKPSNNPLIQKGLNELCSNEHPGFEEVKYVLEEYGLNTY